ncbi:MAG TPA: ABC transporter substrate-binding protein [Alphaproteobacteria bacterium]|nr:ABC transporter substrate-binding protein [Alphaproteobacteria bacterium]
MTTTSTSPLRLPGSPSRRKILTGAAAVALFASLVRGGRAKAAAADAMQTVRDFYDVLLATMRDGQQLGVKGRFDRLAPTIDQTFDLAFMARTAVGPQWLKFSVSERDNVTKALRRYIVATYADNFDDYSGEKLEVSGEDNHTLGRVVHTRLVKPDGVPVTIDYLVHDDGASWRIRDVYLDGQISELAVRRSQFLAILSANGTDGLIAMLNQKADKLAPDTGS